MTGKASNTKTTVDIIKKQRRDQKKAAGLARQNLTGFSSGQASGSVRSPVNSGSSAGSNTGNFIRSSGDTMIGPLAFYYQTKYIAAGTLDVSQASGAYSSRVIVIGQGGAADNLEVILGASNAGQILFFQPIQAVTLQSFLKTATAWATSTSYSVGDVVLDSNQRYTCYTAHTSSSVTDPGNGADWATVWYRNNIRITGATEQVVAVDEIILLQYDSTDSVWTVVSGGGSGGAGLADDNVWTGINTFQGAATSINSATINLGDSATDVINMIAKCNSLATNTWAGTNTFNSGVFFNSAVTFTGTPINFNSNQINLGDNNATDNVFVLATMKMYGDFNANTYDMYNIDRLKFGTTAGSGSALAATDTGIEAVYSGGNSYGMKTVVPANNIYQMFIASSEKVTITTSSIVLNNPVTIGGSVAIGDNYMEYGDMTSANVGTTPANKRRVFSDSANNDELSVKKSDGSVVSLEASGGGGSWNGNATSDLDMNTNNIIDVSSITTGSISTSSITATNSLQSNGTTVLGNQSSDSVIIGGTINGNVVMADNLTIQDDLQVYDDVTLGSSISDDIDINGRVEWGNSYTASVSSYPGVALGYITIKVNGSTRNIWVS
tara:strand:- start:603 stop:2429 length:1827 start_codon:yes stop_codon:yes gene_type:complete